MTTTLFTLTTAGLLCTSVSLLAQTPPAPKASSSPSVAQPVVSPLDYVTLRKLTCRQSTQAEVRALLGQPAAIHSNPDGLTYWEYHAGQQHAKVQFDAENKVIVYLYQSDESSPAATLMVGQVRQLRTGHSEADILRLFGLPTYLIASNNSVDVGYFNHRNHMTLQVYMEEKPNPVVTDFLFSEASDRSPVIDSTKITTIEKEKTTLTDIAGLFGVPTQTVINKFQER